MDPNTSFQGIKKILLVKLKHIGDVLLATPCIRALQEAFPAARISALVNEGTEPMLINHPLLEEVIVFPRSSIRSPLPSRIQGELSFAFSIRKRRFDMVVDLTSADRAAWLAWFSGARYRLAYDPQGKGFLGKQFFYTHLVPHPTDMNLHEVKKNLGILEHFGISIPSPRLEMRVAEGDRVAVNEILKSLGLQRNSDDPASALDFVLVHPTSRWMFKCWEDDRFAHLIDWLQSNCGYPVIVTCGPDPKEMERAHRILALCSTSPRSLLGVLGLVEWAALAGKARIFIGVDSAPMHIAASQETPSVVLFGPTGFQNWRPWAVQHTVLVHDCPCSRDRSPHCDWNQTRACMAAITLEEAKTAVSQLLDKK